MKIMNRIGTYLDRQYSRPTGLVGRIVGEQMVRQHVPETDWTLSLLNLAAEDHVLEIGFGAGRAIELVAGQTLNGQVAGIDLSHEMVRAASRRNAQAIRAGRVTLRQGNVMVLPFSDQQFDKVFSIQNFYFWPDAPLALAGIYRVLKPGGKLVVTLSTGKIGEETGLERYQAIVEEQVIPTMQKLGFSRASVAQGPDSRVFKTMAIIGVK